MCLIVLIPISHMNVFSEVIPVIENGRSCATVGKVPDLEPCSVPNVTVPPLTYL